MSKFNSCLYKCQVGHQRHLPRGHKFSYGVYMFYLDLDELNTLDRDCRFFSNEKFNLFSFYQRDHLKDGTQAPLKERIIEKLRLHGVRGAVGKIFLLTYPRVLGYVFNPVSFYFVYSDEPTPRAMAAIAEVGNTFDEMKVYVLNNACLEGQVFRLLTTKHFYVSPFGKLDEKFDFVLPLPNEALRICVDTLAESGEKVLVASLGGKKMPLSDEQMLRFFFMYPLVTLKVIGMIHYHALLLYLKRVPFIAKAKSPHLQIEVLNRRA